MNKSMKWGIQYPLFIIVAGFLIGRENALIPCFSFIGIILASNILNKLNYEKKELI